jgi:hypothetical protein
MEPGSLSGFLEINHRTSVLLDPLSTKSLYPDSHCKRNFKQYSFSVGSVNLWSLISPVLRKKFFICNE